MWIKGTVPLSFYKLIYPSNMDIQRGTRSLHSFVSAHTPDKFAKLT